MAIGVLQDQLEPALFESSVETNLGRAVVKLRSVYRLELNPVTIDLTILNSGVPRRVANGSEYSITEDFEIEVDTKGGLPFLVACPIHSPVRSGICDSVFAALASACLRNRRMLL